MNKRTRLKLDLLTIKQLDAVSFITQINDDACLNL